MGNDISSVCIPKQRAKKRDDASGKKKKKATDTGVPMDTTLVSMHNEETLMLTNKNGGRETSPATQQKPKATPPELQDSAASFDRPNPRGRRWHGENEGDAVMVTNILTDVKKRYHVNTKE